MGKKLVATLTKKLGREPTTDEIKKAKKLLKARKQAAAEAAAVEAPTAPTVPAAAPSAQKRPAAAPAAAAAAKKPRAPKKLPQKEDPEYLAALMTTIEKMEAAAKLPKLLAETLRATKEPASSTRLPYRGMMEQVVKQTAECAALLAEAASLIDQPGQ